MPPKNHADRDWRRTKVAEGLLGRLSYRQIARKLSISEPTVVRDAAFIRQEWQARRETDSDGWMAEELARLDVAMAAIWSKVLDGDNFTIDRMLSLMERRAKMLGLDTQQALPAAHMQVVILNGDGANTDTDPGSLAALWRSRTIVSDDSAGGALIGPSGDGQVARVS